MGTARSQAVKIEQPVDEPILLADIIVADPPHLPLRIMCIDSYPQSFAELLGTHESSAWPSPVV